MMPDAKFEHCFRGHEPHVRKTRVTLVLGAAVFSEQPPTRSVSNPMTTEAVLRFVK
jgi:hypothetical protein